MGACDVHGISEPGTLTTLAVSPNPASMVIGTTQQFTAVGKDFSGANIDDHAHLVCRGRWRHDQQFGRVYGGHDARDVYQHR